MLMKLRCCHPLHRHVRGQASFSFAPPCRWQWPTSALAAIDIFVHSPGADRRGQREGGTCRSEHGFTSSEGQWHPANSCFLSPSPFFFLFPFLGARTRLLPSRPPALIMAFFALLPSPPVFLPSGAQTLSTRTRFFLYCLLLRHPRPSG